MTGALVLLGLFGAALVGSIIAHRMRFRYFLNLWYSGDCFLNAVRGGDPRETMSSAFGKAVRRGNRVARFVCRLLNRADKEHCEDAIAEDLGDMGVPLPAAIVGVVYVVVAVIAAWRIFA